MWATSIVYDISISHNIFWSFNIFNNYLWNLWILMSVQISAIHTVLVFPPFSFCLLLKLTVVWGGEALILLRSTVSLRDHESWPCLLKHFAMSNWLHTGSPDSPWLRLDLRPDRVTNRPTPHGVHLLRLRWLVSLAFKIRPWSEECLDICLGHFSTFFHFSKKKNLSFSPAVSSVRSLDPVHISDVYVYVPKWQESLDWFWPWGWAVDSEPLLV